MFFKTEGIILKTHCLGEADRIFTILSPDKGKFKAVGKGVRKINSQFSGKMDIFCYLDLVVSKGRNLDVIKQVSLKDSYFSLRNDLKKLAYAMYMLELTDAMLEERDASESIFNLLVCSLKFLEKTPHPELVTTYFQLHFIKLLGYRPSLDKCNVCKHKVGDKHFFSPFRGGIICPDCNKEEQYTQPLSEMTKDLMETMLISPISRLPDFTVKSCRELENILQAVFQYHTGKKFKAVRLIKSI